jgi:hypothetical protein
VDFTDTYNPTMSLYADLRINTEAAEERAYQWWQCMWPIGNYGVPPPAEYPSLLSRFVNDEYHNRICDLSFPLKGNGSHVPVRHRTYAELNKFTGGYSDHRNSTRMLYMNGEWDPWIHTTVSSRFRPGGPMKSSKNVLVNVIPRGGHAIDLDARCNLNPACKEIVEGAVRQMVTWVSEFPKKTV